METIEDKGLELLLANDINPSEYTKFGVVTRLIEKKLSHEIMLEVVYSTDWRKFTKDYKERA